MKWTITSIKVRILWFFVSPPFIQYLKSRIRTFMLYFLKTSIILRFYFDLRFYLKGFNAVGKAENWNPLESQIHSAIFINFIVSIAPDCITSFQKAQALNALHFRIFNQMTITHILRLLIAFLLHQI